MAVNLPEPGELASVPGVALATGSAAIRHAIAAEPAAAPAVAERDDLALLTFGPEASVAGVFTQSSFRAAPVILAEQRIRAGGVRALLINSGNANAATGVAGLADAEALCDTAAAALGIPSTAVVPFSTGVIGERLPVARMNDGIRQLPASLHEAGWLAAAKAIMTTDTVTKACSTAVELDDGSITITGMAKGSGMIRPDMATMLAFVCCDASVSHECLQQLLENVAAASFNRITVDGDTSTNDAFIFVATGESSSAPIRDAQSADARALEAGLLNVSRTLAQAIVRDGEGASKFVTIRVSGGTDQAECLEVAYTVAESPLVKTALFASDPNWGRLAMAIGRARVAGLDVTRVNARFDDVLVMKGGVMAPDYTEEVGAGVLAKEEFCIGIELGRGSAEEEIWTSDLSYDYVRINAEYRT